MKDDYYYHHFAPLVFVVVVDVCIVRRFWPQFGPQIWPKFTLFWKPRFHYPLGRPINSIFKNLIKKLRTDTFYQRLLSILVTTSFHNTLHHHHHHHNCSNSHYQGSELKFELSSFECFQITIQFNFFVFDSVLVVVVTTISAFKIGPFMQVAAVFAQTE